MIIFIDKLDHTETSADNAYICNVFAFRQSLIIALAVGLGGSVVGSVHCVRKVAGSNPTLVAMKGPWASPSLSIAASASAC